MKNRMVIFSLFIFSSTLSSSLRAQAEPNPTGPNEKFSCLFGAYNESHQWQTQRADLTVTKGHGLLELVAGGVLATVDYGLSGNGPLISVQVKDQVSGFRAAADYLVRQPSFGAALYNDKDAHTGGQIYCAQTSAVN